MKRRVLSVLLACMIGVGAFFGSYEKAHAVPVAIPPLLVVGILAACGISIGSSDAVDRFMSKYKDTPLFQAILDQVKADKIQIASNGVILYSISRELIDAVKSFWKENNVGIQAEFGGNIENGIWKGTAELEINFETDSKFQLIDSSADFHCYNLGNVTLTYGKTSPLSANYCYSRCLLVPFGTYSLDYDGNFSSFSFSRTCLYSYTTVDQGLTDLDPGSSYEETNGFHYCRVYHENWKRIDGCQYTKYYVRYVGEDASSYIYERSSVCSRTGAIDPSYEKKETIHINKSVIGAPVQSDIKLDDVNKKLDELKEGQWFVAPDTNGSISENPDDYAGLTVEDVIYGGGAVNPNQCICSDDVINKACPLHGIGCPDCICVGNDYAKDCPVHGSLVDTDVKTGILSDIYAGVRSIANTLTDALAGVGEGVYTGVKEIAATLRDMFKPSDFDLSFDGFKSIGLSNKFPFCIPFDFYDCIAVWSADASNYKLHVDVNTSFWKVNHTVDMSQFSTPIKFFRLFCIVIFSYILITRTRSLMKW
ncbi:hypothetical protein P0G10_06725 [Eubacteriales bacterium DFI.9.88]|nr:hypothetical protein [Eubacteriales bacterium DFI.9.88]